VADVGEQLRFGLRRVFGPLFRLLEPPMHLPQLRHIVDGDHDRRVVRFPVGVERSRPAKDRFDGSARHGDPPYIGLRRRTPLPNGQDLLDERVLGLGNDRCRVDRTLQHLRIGHVDQACGRRIDLDDLDQTNDLLQDLRVLVEMGEEVRDALGSKLSQVGLDS
jgi:hypothetical protein